MNALERLAILGGAARFSELGSSRYRLARLVESGAIRRPARGVYALPSAPAHLIAAATENAVVSCRSALELLGIETYGDATLTHLSLPRHRGSGGVRNRFVRRHRESPQRHGAARIACLADAAARAATCLPYDLAVAQLERLAPGHPSPILTEVLQRISRLGRPGRARALEVDVEPGARSHIETAVRLHLRRAGLGALAAVHLPGIGEVDLLVEGLVIVELDGFAYHGDRHQYRTDRRRDRAALRLGLPTLRFAFEDSDPDRVLRAVIGVCLQLQRSPLTPDVDSPSQVQEAVARACAAARAPQARATGWRHLRGRDRSQVTATLPTHTWQAPSPSAAPCDSHQSTKPKAAGGPGSQRMSRSDH